MPDKNLKPEEQANRNKLKTEKPYVYEKMIKLGDKIRNGESIAIIQFQYNYKCNLKCEHCSVKRFQGKKNKRSSDPPASKTTKRNKTTTNFCSLEVAP